MSKFDDLIFTIPKEFHSWYGFAAPRGFFRGTTMMEKARLYMDFTSITKELVMEVPHTHHCADEYLLLATADITNFFNFDAEIEIWLGDDPNNLELYTLTEPTIIRVPPKLYHCPIYFKRIGTPVLFSAIYLDGDWSKINRTVNEEGREVFTYDGAGVRRCVHDTSKECIYCGQCFSDAMKKRIEEAKGGATASMADQLKPFYEAAHKPSGRFDQYVHTFKPEVHDDERFQSPRVGFRGTSEMPGSRLRYVHDIVQKECEVGELHMHHAVEEYWFFYGADITNFFEFDAEVEFSLGEDPDHMETFTITEPTLVRIPQKMWHGPIKFKRIGAPIDFMPFYPNGEYGKIVQEKLADGTLKYIYTGTDLPE